MTKSEKISIMIKKMKMLDENELDSISKAVDACSLVQILKSSDISNIKSIIGNEGKVV